MPNQGKTVVFTKQESTCYTEKLQNTDSMLKQRNERLKEHSFNRVKKKKLRCYPGENVLICSDHIVTQNNNIYEQLNTH